MSPPPPSVAALQPCRLAASRPASPPPPCRCLAVSPSAALASPLRSFPRCQSAIPAAASLLLPAPLPAAAAACCYCSLRCLQLSPQPTAFAAACRFRRCQPLSPRIYFSTPVFSAPILYSATVAYSLGHFDPAVNCSVHLGPDSLSLSQLPLRVHWFFTITCSFFASPRLTLSIFIPYRIVPNHFSGEISRRGIHS